MSPIDSAQELRNRALFSEKEAATVAAADTARPFSVHWELRALLSLGVLLLSGGLGLVIYDNFENIGQTSVLLAIAGLCGVSFWLAWRNRAPYAPDYVASQNALGDSALLLGCLLFLALEGYAQYAYNVFGTRYGLVTFVPAMLFLPLAYRFDHRGVLGMALTALVSWVGVTVRPLELRFKTNFFDLGTVLSALALAGVLIGGGLLLARRGIKAHFLDTYLLVAGNLLGVALLAGIFNFEGWRLAFAAGLAVAVVVADRYALRSRTLMFALMSAIYGFIGLTYLFFHYVADVGLVVGAMYFIITGVAMIWYLLRRRQQLGEDEGV